MKFSIGQAVGRLEDRRLVTGNGRYTDDISLLESNQSETLVAAILRSPHAHARILGIDTASAVATDGVIAVYTHTDLQTDGIGVNPCMVQLDNRDGSKQAETPWPLLAQDRVRFVGDPVALVIAQSETQARDAMELINVDYQTLASSTDTEDTVKEHAAPVWDDISDNTVFDWQMGDQSAVDAALANAHEVINLRLVNNRVIVASMEPRPVYVKHDGQSHRSTIYSSTQGPDFIHAPLAEQVLGIEKNSLRCVTQDVGGGFGMKVFLYHEHALMTWASRKLERDIRFNPARSDAFLADVHGRDHVSYAEAGLDENLVICALKVTTYANMGAYLSNFGPYIPTDSGANMAPGAYTIPACYVNVKGVLTNTTPVDAYRGAGRPEAAYLVERLVDYIAREKGIGVDEIRRRNFIPPESMPYKTALGNVYDSGDFSAVMNKAMQAADWSGANDRRQKALQRDRLLGIGMATYIERCGGGGALPAQININDDDSVSILSGTQSNGQGHQTAFSQIVSDTLGIDVDRINLIQGDTDVTPPGFTGGSRSVPVGGSAVLEAARTIIEKGRRTAAIVFESAEQDIEFKNGTFSVAGTDRRQDFFEIARYARDNNIDFGEQQSLSGLDTSHAFTPDEATYPNGCHICELEIDKETGTCEITNYTVVDDFGEVINPLLLEGQVHGGIAQGIGQAILERVCYDEDSGQLLTGSFMDYCLPRADSMPSISFSTLNIPCVNNPLGVKGAGEAGAIGAPPAVINAIVDALAADTGITHIDMPATAERIWSLLHSAT